MGVPIFVFGSNLAGRHGKGAALTAKRYYGAIQGQGIGLQGQSYGIPTKDAFLRVLPISEITKYVDQFLDFSNNHSELEFNVTPIGCGLAGYSYNDIAPLFVGHPANVYLNHHFLEVLYKGVDSSPA